jgi:hypothetical protein
MSCDEPTVGADGFPLSFTRLSFAVSAQHPAKIPRVDTLVPYALETGSVSAPLRETRRYLGYDDAPNIFLGISWLSVEQLSVLGSVINLKTAKALGITIPESILMRADEVIR